MVRKMSSKDRILRHMARDKPDFYKMMVHREDLLDVNDIPGYITRPFESWERWMKIKHGKNVRLTISHEFCLDFNNYWFIGEVYRVRA